MLSIAVRVINNVKGTFKTCPGFWMDRSVSEVRVAHTWRPEANPCQPFKKPGIVMHTFHPGVGEVERTCHVSSPRVPRLQAQRKRDPRITQATDLWPPHMHPHLHSYTCTMCTCVLTHACAPKREENTFQFQQWSLSVCCRIIKTEVENPKNQSVWFFITPPTESLKCPKVWHPWLFLVAPWLILAMKSHGPHAMM